MHATSIPPGQAPYVATKGKRWESDSIKGLILEWNKDSFEKENFIVCGLCGVRRFGFFELPTELHEVEQCNIDQLQQGKNEIPRNLRLHILDHISHHLEELALLSFPVTDRSGKGKNTDPLTSNVLSASPNNASNPVFNQTPCDWLTTLNPDKCYRWRYDAEGNIQYQWGTTQSSYGPRESKPSEDQSMGSKYQDPANSMYQSSSWGSHLKSQYSTEPSNRPSSLSSYSQSLYSGKLSQLYSSSNADTQHHSAPQNQPDLIGHSSRIAQPTLGGDKGIRPLKPSIGGIEHEKLHLSMYRY
jgi:hypothetical protein